MEVFTYYFWTFVLGSVLGVVMETIWCLIKNKKFESRKGLIYGPFNPLYGVAAVFLSYFINSLDSPSVGRVFLIGVVVSSFVEYVCSYYQERLLGTVSWDYKNFKFNLNGRINLVYSLAWGVLTLFWCDTFMPLVEEGIPFFMENVNLTIIFAILLALDCLISLCASIRHKQRREKIYPRTRLEKHFDYLYTDELMDLIYPNSVFKDEL